MVLFLFALVITVVGVGVFDLYNPGVRSIAVADHHIATVRAVVPVALAAAVPLSLFLLYALWTSPRIWLLKRAAKRAAWEWELVQPGSEERVTPPWPAPEHPVAQRAPILANPVAGVRRRRASQAPPPAASPQPAPKRSWLTDRD